MTDHNFDVLVIGSGAAGLYTALCLPSNLRVGLISKEPLPISASDWAQGGIAAAIAPDDSAQLHIQDTLNAGAGLCDPEAVKFLVENAPHCIEALIHMGVAFDRHDQEIALTLEAAHSRRRVLHAADTTGRAIVSILAGKVLEQPHITILSSAFALNLWLDPSTNTCRGVSIIEGNQLRWLRAQAVILATGGGGQVFAQTTNPEVSTGDGVAMAWRAGAVLRDLEFFQFHPTALTQPGAPHFLISEAVRGEGAHLVDSQGHRFVFDYHPSGELAPRDVVSRAIFRHLQKTGESHVWLDLKPIPTERIHQRFPNIIQVCHQWGIDLFHQPIPVAPAAHYWMGGIQTDQQNQTSISGLYAVGETASTGVHGANRLASNSLLECIVFGAQMAHWYPQIRHQENEKEDSRPDNFLEQEIAAEEEEKMILLRQKVAHLMWNSAGICREQTTMERAIAQIEKWRTEYKLTSLSQISSSLTPGQVLHFPLKNAQNPHLRAWGETGNLLDIAYLILSSALFRTESRGGHYRLDYLSTDPQWQTHTLIRGYEWSKSTPL